MNQNKKHRLHVVITSSSSELDEKNESKINDIFSELFNNSYKLASRVKESSVIELIYEVQTPIFDDDNMSEEFYNNLRILLEILQEYNPHFTQFRRVTQ